MTPVMSPWPSQCRSRGPIRVLVRGAAYGVGGMVAMCGAAQDSESHIAGFLALTTGTGVIRNLIRTEPYGPTAVLIAQDGTVWTKGTERETTKRALAKTDRGILRHFDATGKLLAEFLPQSSLSNEQLSLGIDLIACNAKHVGWYMSRGAAAYFEVSDGGVNRFPLLPASEPTAHDGVIGLTILDDDRVFAVKYVNGNNPVLYLLDRSARVWNSVTIPAGGTPTTTGWLLGGSGNSLVFKTAQSNLLRRFTLEPQ